MTTRVLLAVLLMAIAPLPVQAVRYVITDLGTLGGTYSQASALNIHGDVVGSSTTTSGEEHAFLYHNGVMTDLGVLNSGDTFSQAFGINDLGVVVGQSVGATTNPFYYAGGQMHFVGSLGGNYGFATAINNSLQIVGISSDQNGATHAFRTTGAMMTDLGTFYDYSVAYGINSAGDVAGYSTTSASNHNAFLYHAGNLQDLGNLYRNSRGFAINDVGHVAGASEIDAVGHERAFLWHDGIMDDLGTVAGAVTSQALGMNNLDHVVGTLVFDPADGTKNHGFLYADGIMVDVNTLLPVDSGWVLRDAQGINDLGQIVGFGNIGGEQHAYLLTPVPEPSGLVLIAAAGLISASTCRWPGHSRGYSRRFVSQLGRP